MVRLWRLGGERAKRPPDSCRVDCPFRHGFAMARPRQPARRARHRSGLPRPPSSPCPAGEFRRARRSLSASRGQATGRHAHEGGRRRRRPLSRREVSDPGRALLRGDARRRVRGERAGAEPQGARGASHGRGWRWEHAWQERAWSWRLRTDEPACDPACGYLPTVARPASGTSGTVYSATFPPLTVLCPATSGPYRP